MSSGRLTIFIDNGTSGTIGAIDGQGLCAFCPTPTLSMQDYTKAKKTITRIDVVGLSRLLEGFLQDRDKSNAMVVLERPMINPARFLASISASRALEATITVLEHLGLPYQFVDSKQWQRGLLPLAGKKGTDSATLKKESMDIGIRMFPQFADLIRKHKDADGILGAYALRNL